MDSIHLHGAEDVRSAGSAMVRAADTMQSAASSIWSALDQHARTMTDLVERFERAVEAIKEPRPVYTVDNPNEPKAYGGV